ncbi:alkaline phosphatase-like protein, partial [Leptotrombidium deliense]
MVEKSICILRKNNNGFFMFVEGGRIDHAHHVNQAKKALDETYQFNKAIEKALAMVNTSETLIIVAADHSHSLTINGYQHSGGDILGSTFGNYTTLLYGNGPGYYRDKLATSDSADKEYQQTSAAYKQFSAHSGEDVPVYATGPGSQFLSGVFDQTFIPYVVSVS